MNAVDGVVVRLEGEFAWVRTRGAGSACGACSRKEGCGTRSDAESLLKLPNPIRAHPGDAVLIEVADGVVLRAAWRAYGLPLMLALIGAGIAMALTGTDGIALVAMLCGLAVGFGWLRRHRCDSGQSNLKMSMDFKNLS
jgi:positive regulator of sigma E activity